MLRQVFDFYAASGDDPAPTPKATLLGGETCVPTPVTRNPHPELETRNPNPNP